MDNKWFIALLVFAIVSTYTFMPSVKERRYIEIEPATIAGANVKPATTGEMTAIYDSLGTYELTAYCPCARCCGNTKGITSTGTKATAGRTIAVDPKKIPYGSEVVINGHVYIAEDCGGAIKGKRIDIFCDSHAEAIAFGRQYADVKIRR